MDFWAVTRAVAGVVLTSLAGCIWVECSTRKNPSSFDGYPFVGFIALGVGALVALGLGLEGATDQR